MNSDDGSQQINADLQQRYHAFQAEISNQAVKQSLIINGGACVALLAFLQSIWKTDSKLAEVILYGISSFCMGVLLAGASSFVMYRTSKSFQGQSPYREWWKHTSYTVQYASLVMFVIGVVITVVGALGCLPNR